MLEMHRKKLLESSAYNEATIDTKHNDNFNSINSPNKNNKISNDSTYNTGIDNDLGIDINDINDNSDGESSSIGNPNSPDSSSRKVKSLISKLTSRI